MASSLRRRGRRHHLRPRRRRSQRGGATPFVVDCKKGFQLLTDPELWTIPDEEKDKRLVERYKRQWRESGTRDSYKTWLVRNGYAKRVTTCCLT